MRSASREVVVHSSRSEVHADILRFVASAGGDVEAVGDTYIEALFGSKAATFFKGAGFAKADDLPKKLEAYLQDGGGTTSVRITVSPNQSFGTLGAENTYEEALSAFADRVVTALVT